MKPRTGDLARGKWQGILLALKVDRKFLSRKHTACPSCGGTDRFRFDDKGGNGCWICNVCGAGNGFDLLKLVHGWDFSEAAAQVDKVLGNVERDPVRKPTDEAAIRERKRRLWTDARPLEVGDPAYNYLAGRVSLPKSLPACLKFAPSCMAPDGTPRPALLALVEDSEGKGRNIHRTFLGPNGKADMPDPRAMMPGSIPDGSAVRLFPVHGERLGIAEGIETAFAAAARFGIPVWSAINATMLKKWTPPATVREVLIFGDSDAKFGGQAAAYHLAHRLAAQFNLAVDVHVPTLTGRDWADSDAA